MTGRFSVPLRVAAVTATAAIVSAIAALPATAAEGDIQVVNTETVQVYTSPTGEVETKRIYEQLAVTGNGTVELQNPISTDGLRNLDGFGGFDVENGNQITKMTVDGEEHLRTVSDYTGKLPLDVTVEYYLDGKRVEPGDIVGESGKLEVKYIVKNVTGVEQEVSFPDGNGGTVTKTVNVPIPMVGSLTTTAPGNFTNVASGQANMAGDGKGATKLSFTMTLFPPIGSDTAEFGYTADITDGVVPRTSISALPVNPLESPTFASAASSYKGGADTGIELTAGATEIDANLLKLRDGASELLAGLIKLREGAQQLEAGLAGEAAPGANRLADGASQLAAGTDELFHGTGDLVNGTGKLKSGAAQLNDGAGRLAAGADELSAGASQLADGSKLLGSKMGEAAAGGKKLHAGAQQIAGGAGQAAAGSKQLADGTGQALVGSKTLSEGLVALETGAAALSEGFNSTVGAQDLVDGSKALRDGLAQISGGLGQLADAQTGLPAAKKGAEALRDGVGRLSLGISNPSCDPANPQNPANPCGLIEGLDGLLAGVTTAETGAKAISNGATALNDQLLPGISVKVNSAAGSLADADASAESVEQTIAVLKPLLATVCETTAAICDEITEIETGLETLNSDIAAGTAELGALTAPGVGLLAQASAVTGQLKPGAAALVVGLSQASAGVKALQVGAARIGAGLSNPNCSPLDPQNESNPCGVAQGLDSLIAGLTKAIGGVNQLAPGAGTAYSGSATLHESIVKAGAGAGQLAGGLVSASDGGESLAAGLVEINAGAGQLSAGLGVLAAGSGELVTGTATLSDGLFQLAAGANDVSDGAGKVAGGAGQLADGAGELQDGTGRLAAGVNELDAGAGKLRDGAGRLNDGAGQLADGANQLADGLQDAADGSGQLAGGLEQAAEGAPQLVDGAQRLSDEGTSKLVEAGQSTAQNYGELYATIAAGAERAQGEKMAFGAPEGAIGLTAYSYEIKGDDGEGSRNWTRGLGGLAVLAAGAGAFALRRRMI